MTKGEERSLASGSHPLRAIQVRMRWSRVCIEKTVTTLLAVVGAIRLWYSRLSTVGGYLSLLI